MLERGAAGAVVGASHFPPTSATATVIDSDGVSTVATIVEAGSVQQPRRRGTRAVPDATMPSSGMNSAQSASADSFGTANPPGLLSLWCAELRGEWLVGAKATRWRQWLPWTASASVSLTGTRSRSTFSLSPMGCGGECERFGQRRPSERSGACGGKGGGGGGISSGVGALRVFPAGPAEPIFLFSMNSSQIPKSSWDGGSCSLARSPPSEGEI